MQKTHLNLLLFIIMIIAAAAMRIIPHPPNFAPITALALYGAAAFNKRWSGIALAISAMFLSDLILGFHDTMHYVYGGFAIVAVIGLLLRKNISFITVPAAAIAGSLTFFFITNFGVWMQGTMYPMTYTGLVSAYAAGLPFLKNAMAGDLVYTTLMFGITALVLSKNGSLPEHWSETNS